MKTNKQKPLNSEGLVREEKKREIHLPSRHTHAHTRTHTCTHTCMHARTAHICKWVRIQWASLVVQMVKRLPAMLETQVRSLGWEDPLEKGMATHSSTLAWKIPWTEEPGRLKFMGSQRVGHDWATSLTHLRIQLLQDSESPRVQLFHGGFPTGRVSP